MSRIFRLSCVAALLVLAGAMPSEAQIWRDVTERGHANECETADST